MTPAERRRVARVLRESERIVAEETYWLIDEPHRHLRVMMLLFEAEAVLTGDCE